MGFELVLFGAMGLLAIIFAVGMLLSENAVHSALFLIGNFGCVAILFLMLEAPFIGMVQIAVYAGAIMVLFLFVIMLLGADQTSDTTRRFRWLTGAATTLVVAMLAAFGTPLILGGLTLPTYEGETPQLRVVNGAQIADSSVITVAISGPTLEEDLRFETLPFGETSAFETLPAGSYTVNLLREDGVPVSPPQPLSLELGSLTTLLAYGAIDPEAGTFIQIAPIASDLSDIPGEQARIQVFNAYGSEPLTLVDLGPNRALDTGNRTQRDENGDPVLDETGQPVQALVIADAVLAEQLAFGALSEETIFPRGEYSLAFVDGENNIVFNLFDYRVTSATEQTIIIVEEPAPLEDAAGRPRVLDRDQNSLTLATQPSFGSPMGIGLILFTDYLLPVNIVGFLLLVAMVGVIVLARPDGEKLLEKRITRRRRVSRPLINVISTQTGTDVIEEAPRLNEPGAGD